MYRYLQKYEIENLTVHGSAESMALYKTIFKLIWLMTELSFFTVKESVQIGNLIIGLMYKTDDYQHTQSQQQQQQKQTQQREEKQNDELPKQESKQEHSDLQHDQQQRLLHDPRKRYTRYIYFFRFFFFLFTFFFSFCFNIKTLQEKQKDELQKQQDKQ